MPSHKESPFLKTLLECVGHFFFNRGNLVSNIDVFFCNSQANLCPLALALISFLSMPWALNFKLHAYFTKNEWPMLGRNFLFAGSRKILKRYPPKHLWTQMASN